MTTIDSDLSDSAAELVSFVPRLTIEWLRSSPDLRWLEVDGTLAFVDISGFTAMSEQLSSRGRAGAEEVTDVMNATFSALLDRAYGHGAGLLKFGGRARALDARRGEGAWTAPTGCAGGDGVARALARPRRHPDRARGAQASARSAARRRAVRGRASARGDRVRPLLGCRRNHRDRGT